jgi:3-hydroxyacyl-CoA dehydrogenase/enoyl-CoA hydratase/3-hydroxybutyryl-CoA epimerase/enoyl-CoA isomerase
MHHQGKAITLRALESGIVELCFDRDADAVNKFDQLTLGELGEALGQIAADSGVRGVLITSAKPEYFIVGADIGEFGALFRQGEAALLENLARANAIFNALEDLAVPSVCAINGTALGGGLELCLAADARVMSRGARVGLPEVKLGINPGFGGTVRLPRVIGVDNAVEWICGGSEYKAEVALKVGAVDAVVEPARLREAALDLLRQCMDGTLDYAARRREKTQPVQLNDIERMMAFMTGKSVVAAQAGPNMPAPVTAAKSMEKSVGLSRDEALEVEAKFFARLALTNEADSLIGLFLNEQAVSKKAREWESAGRKVTHAAVLGAGTMGGGVAYQFGAVDFVVEAVVENENVKKRVLAECEAVLGSDAVLASNTSTIPISLLAKGLKRPRTSAACTSSTRCTACPWWRSSAASRVPTTPSTAWWPTPPPWASPRSWSTTARASSSTACCSPTSSASTSWSPMAPTSPPSTR